nr:hypothetical protein [Burkholderia ubonensis]
MTIPSGRTVRRGLAGSSRVSLSLTGGWNTSSEPDSILRGAQYSIGQLIPDDNACRGIVLPTNAIGREIGAQDHPSETDLGIRKSRDFHHYRLGRVVINHVNFPRRVEKEVRAINSLSARSDT